MDILLVENDPLIRDQIKVGLKQFPEFHVTTGEGYAALNELRQRNYDVVFLGVEGRGARDLKLLEHMRSLDPTTELIVVTSDRQTRDMQRDKVRFGISAFLSTPIDASDFFRMIGRMRERRAMAEESQTATPAVSRGRR